MDKWLIKASSSKTLPDERDLSQGPSNSSESYSSPLTEKNYSKLNLSKSSNESDSDSDMPKPKRHKKVVVKDEKRICHFNTSWMSIPQWSSWLTRSEVGGSSANDYAFCKLCNQTMLAHITVIKNHAKSSNINLFFKKYQVITTSPILIKLVR